VPDGRALARHYVRVMAKARKRESGDEELEAASSTVERLSRAVRAHPVTTLAVGAGVGAIFGAELLAAGLVGGAAVLLLQRSDLRARARHFVETAKERISDVGERSTAQHA
jgi:ElaB/YqjD/DUF883 family membrane-anchored ribosome-binding protein